ncbi:MAG: hypothetical protein M1832_003257 [Thelocarpon impressellum]|nr:MAG: hypothetical protein M1832_003257 [Thelocarpon impressellum]
MPSANIKAKAKPLAYPKRPRTSTENAKKKPTHAYRNGIKSKPTAYNKFIKEHYKATAAENPHMETPELRKLLSDKWKDHPTNPKAKCHELAPSGFGRV